MTREIRVLRPTETALFAAGELARYLRLISETPVDFRIREAQPTLAAKRAASPAIALGLIADVVPPAQQKGLSVSPEDDTVVVDVRNGAGVIAGSNDRAILLAVYRFLHALGCRWVRPGIQGEFVPRRDLAHATATLRHQASYRHRVVCIEGAVSIENVVDMIDWAPKVGFSGYFMQFPDGEAFFSRWYSRVGSEGAEAEPFSRQAARAFTLRIEAEIRRRSLQYHAVGHGWTCRALGLDVSHWNPVYLPLDEDERGMLAEVGGVRAMRWDRPMITSLCFSRADVRQRMVRVIVEHAQAHPEVDLLHVWLDDGGQNKCECLQCRKKILSEWYADLLHELDAALTKAKSPMRIVFIGYSDLLWAPLAAKKLDPHRFSFVYANSRRSYGNALPDPATLQPTVPELVLNKSKVENTPEEFLGFLQGWQRFFGGDSMLFEYFLTIGRQTFDQFALARVIHSDMRRLRDYGFQGLISCQIQRAFFPVGIPMYTMGQTLWDDTVEIDALLDDYFHAAFGPESALCKEFLKVSAEQLNRVAKFGATLEILPGAHVALTKLDALVREFRKVVARNAQSPDPCHAHSFHLMTWHLRILERLLGLYRVMQHATPEATVAQWREVREFVTANEHHYQPVFDVWNFVSMLDGYIVNGRFSSAPEDVVARTE